MYQYKAEVLEVKDGDTVELRIDLGFRIRGLELERGRLYGIDAPEKRTAAGKEAKAWLEAQLPVGSTVFVQTVKVKSGEKVEKFGGYLVILFRTDDFGGPSLNTEMLNLGLARPYMGALDR